MPPSGYNNHQAQSIEGFLKSILESLIKEAEEKDYSPCIALAKECSNIEAILEDGANPYQHSVLSITHAFYRALEGREPDSIKELRWASVEELDRVRGSILAIHVPETEEAQQGDG